jgi:iron complex outermembrane receptor protein
MKTTFRSAVLVSTALACAWPLAGRAQEVKRETSDDTGSIIVTARRMEERLQDVPISITVFNQQQLADRNIVTASDLGNYTPSLSTNTNFGSDNSSFAIRGFVQDIGTAPSVGVYFADVVAPRGGSNGTIAGNGAGPGSFFDLQNVQVLKGPQGTLQGRNTTGGAILLVPQKPTEKLEGYVQASGGNYDMWRVQGVLNIPLSDTFRLRVGADHQQRNGYLHNTTGIGPSDFNNVNYTAVRASIVGDLTPNLENYTIASYNISHTNGQVQKPVACDRNAANISTSAFLQAAACSQIDNQAAAGQGFYDVESDVANPVSRLQTWQVINTTTWKATDTLTAKNIISYAQLKDTINSDLFGTAFSPTMLEAPYAARYGASHFTPGADSFDFAQNRVVPGGDSSNESTFTEEFQLQGHSGNNGLVWQGGAYLESSLPLGLVGSLTPSVNNCTNLAAIQCTDIVGSMLSYALGIPQAAHAVHVGSVNLTSGRASYHDVGLYAQATQRLTDRFKITAGFRYTWDRQVDDVQQTTFGTFPYPPNVGTYSTLKCTFPDASNATTLTAATYNATNNCLRHLEQRSSAPTWLIDLDYTPSRDMLIYGKYQRGYRSGTISPNITSNLAIVKPEKVYTFEVGSKTSFHGPVHGTFNVDGFYNNFTNQQLQLGFQPVVAGSVSPTAAPINAGKSRIWGIEVEGNVALFEGFTVSGGYTYLNTKILKINPITLPAGSPYVLTDAYMVGDPTALSPRNKFTITGSYMLPIDRALGKLSVSATFTHTDRQLVNYGDRDSTVASIQPLSYVQATNLLNLNLDWLSVGGHPVDLSVFATNVTNQQYLAFTPGLAAPGGAGLETAVLGQPRMVGGSAKFHF